MKLPGIQHIGIIGTGMIGSSLALLFTGNGYRTTVLANSEKGAKSGLQRYETYCQDLMANNLVSPGQARACQQLLSITFQYEDLADADFIFECVVEKLPVKQAVYAELEKHCRQLQVIASATSAISADELATCLVQKDKLLVAHPYNPPHLVPAVEVVKSQYTRAAAVQTTLELLQSVGRAPVVMKKGAPGFIANRLQHALYREAAHMVEQGYASPEDIDITLQTSFMPRYTSIGLFQHFDYAGLDMIMSIHQNLFPTLCNAVAPQDLIRIPFEAGLLGYKTGQGVLDWTGVDINEFRKKASAPYLKFFNWSLPE